jgi:fatty-acyl-CoA synthase
VIADHAGAKVDNAAVDYDDLLVLLHLRHHRPPKAAVLAQPDGLCGDKSSHRPDAGLTETMPRWWLRPCYSAGVHSSSGRARADHPAAIEKFDIAEAFRLIERTASATCSRCRRS